MRKFDDFQIGQLFFRETTNTYKGFNAESLVSPNGDVPVVVNSSRNNGVAGYSLLAANNDGNVITFSDTVNSDETLFYQADDFIGFSHVNKLIPKHNSFNKYQALYVIVAIKKSIKGLYDYATKFTEDIDKTVIKLPVTLKKNSEPDWDYMESYIREAVPKYLTSIKHDGDIEISKIRDRESGISKMLGIDDFELSCQDYKILETYQSAEWLPISVCEIFDTIKRGKRLIEANRLIGELPFITAGVLNQGISSYISNPDIEIFPANSLTIDMFGKVFYRDFEYGADDHIAILYDSTGQLSKEFLLFVAPIIEKSILGKFDYSQNFYASDAYDITINLPIKNKKPDFKLIEKISKIMIKKSLSYYEQEIARHEQEIARHEQEIALIISNFLENI